MASILEIILKTVKQGTGVQQTEKEITSLGKATAGLNKILGAAGLAIGAKELIDAGMAAVAAARESAAAEGQLQAALNASGQASAAYSAQLENLATQLENTTNFTDEAVMGAQSILVGFRNIGQVTPQIIATVADMGQQMGNLDAAAKLAGRALNEPLKAGEILRRSGILLAQQQRDQIAAMVEVGNMAGAQGIVLDALNQKYAGQAEAARQAAGGAQEWAVATGRLQEEFGKLLLTIGDSGVGGAAVGLVDTLTEGATTWSANVEQIQLFVDALNNANQALNNTGAASAQAAQEVGVIQQIQKGWEIILTKTAHAAIESTVGWDQLRESYGQVAQEAAIAEEATRQANEAIAQTPLATGASEQALGALAARWQGLANAQRTMSGGRDVLETMAGGSTFTTDEAAAFKAQQKEKEQAAKEFSKSMSSSFQKAADDIGNIISGKLQTTFQEVFKLPEGSADEADEPARRLATVAAAGFGSEWLAQLGQQFSGQAFWQPMAAAIAAGDEGQLKAAATGALTQFSQGLIPQLWDVEVIKGQVRAQIQQGRIKEQLIETVKQELGAEGVTAAVGVVEAAAGNVGVATAQTETNVSTMAATATAAGEQIKGAFSGPIGEIDTLILRIEQLNKMLERTKVLAGEAGSAIGGLNPPNAAGNGNLDGQAALGPPARW